MSYINELSRSPLLFSAPGSRTLIDLCVDKFLRLVTWLSSIDLNICVNISVGDWHMIKCYSKRADQLITVSLVLNIVVKGLVAGPD